MGFITSFLQFIAAILVFNWIHLSWDLFILAGWIIGSLIYAFTAHRGSNIHILLSIYIAKLIIYEAPFLNSFIYKYLPNSLLPAQELVIFTLIFGILFIFLRHYHFRSVSQYRIFRGIFFAPIFAFLQVGLLINTILGYLTLSTQKHFQLLIQILFISSTANLVWLIAPPLFLISHGLWAREKNTNQYHQH